MSDPVRKVPEKRARPNRVELANHYYKDAADFLALYRLAWQSETTNFQAVKSRRAKAYVNLLMATETLLKSMVCLRTRYGFAGADLLKYVRSFSHGISPLAKAAFDKVGLKDRDAIMAMLDRCDSAPVTFRYDYDASIARSEDEASYYKTIGDDTWLKELETFLTKGVERMGKVLARQSKLVSGRVAFEELLRRK